jgi:hypothetical protein
VGVPGTVVGAVALEPDADVGETDTGDLDDAGRPREIKPARWEETGTGRVGRAVGIAGTVGAPGTVLFLRVSGTAGSIRAVWTARTAGSPWALGAVRGVGGFHGFPVGGAEVEVDLPDVGGLEEGFAGGREGGRAERTEREEQEGDSCEDGVAMQTAHARADRHGRTKVSLGSEGSAATCWGEFHEYG